MRITFYKMDRSVVGGTWNSHLRRHVVSQVKVEESESRSGSPYFVLTSFCGENQEESVLDLYGENDVMDDVADCEACRERHNAALVVCAARSVKK